MHLSRPAIARVFATVVGFGVMASVPLLGSCTNSGWVAAPPFEMPIEIESSRAAVVSEFRVDKSKLYAISLQFNFEKGNKADRARMWDLAGGRYKARPGVWLEPGSPLSIRVIVIASYPNNAKPLIDQLVQKPRLTSWDANSLSSELVALKLDPGLYRVDVAIVDAAPALEGTSAEIGIAEAYRGK